MNQPKKRKSSLAMFSEVLKSEDVKNELNEIYNAPTITKKEVAEKPISEEEQVQVPTPEPVVVEPKQDPEKTVSPKPQTLVEEKSPALEMEKQETEEREDAAETPKTTYPKKEKEPAKEFTTIRIDKKKVTALLILAKSGEFPGVSNQTDMLDFILNYYCEKKKTSEILKKGIQF
ncbi:MAG: hypothetical protein ACWA6U_16645 [Breznakibacter sp.]